jgi:DNA-binding NarL/FixJ family response regulator
MTIKKILMIDDNEAWRKLVPEILVMVGIEDVEVVEAETAESGEKIYRNMIRQEDKPELVLMDIRLPNQSGCEGTKDILEKDNEANIYGFTGYNNPEEISRMKKAGAKGVISKMSAVVTIGKQIKEALEHGQ